MVLGFNVISCVRSCVVEDPHHQLMDAQGPQMIYPYSAFILFEGLILRGLYSGELNSTIGQVHQGHIHSVRIFRHKVSHKTIRNLSCTDLNICKPSGISCLNL